MSLSHVPSPAQTAAKGGASSHSAPLLAGETDSPLEGKGFEPSVPRKAPGILAASALVRGVFPLARNQAEAT